MVAPTNQNPKNSNKKKYDICIIGSGPAGLACLSAIREPYSIDVLNDEQTKRANRFLHKSSSYQQPSVCIIDPHSQWMSQWKKSFELLKIQYLRSPALAHPSLFDSNALLAYAFEQGRGRDELLESGLYERKELLALGQAQVGLWKLPSTKLFNDFCDDLSGRLEHDYVQGAAVKVEKCCLNDDRNLELTVEKNMNHHNEKEIVQADHIIIAMGPIGKPIVPQWLKIKGPRVCQWTEMDYVMKEAPKRVLVLGGGLTAVQVAQRCATTAHKVILCSRRALAVRHFDIPVEWFNRQSANKCMHDFYHLSDEERLALLKTTRGGGSVPPVYMKDLNHLEKTGKLRRIVGTPEVELNDDCDDSASAFNPIRITLRGEKIEVDMIVVACGYKPDFQSHPLIDSITKVNEDLEFLKGFPKVTEDLQIADNIFVTGALGSLNTGPDSGNLMGIRRASQIVANALDCSLSTNRLRNESNVFENRYDAFLSDSDSDSESDTE